MPYVRLAHVHFYTIHPAHMPLCTIHSAHMPLCTVHPAHMPFCTIHPAHMPLCTVTRSAPCAQHTHTGRQARDRQTNRQTNRQTGRQTDRHPNTQVGNLRRISLSVRILRRKTSFHKASFLNRFFALTTHILFLDFAEEIRMMYMKGTRLPGLNPAPLKDII